ncbi:MAG: heparinase II/III family protein [Planctomycetes bacterium]|nr:heparinase II/III family protein [Planctomycetota bacterium]MBL7145111.1 heparinase II/III family protein [Phycisphaerae bacterium]
MKRMKNCSMFFKVVTLALLTSSIIISEGAALGAAGTIDQNRIKYISTLLPAKPVGFGSHISDRNTWKKLAGNDAFQKIILDAEKLLQQPIPDQPDDLFLDFSRTGNRTRWQKVSGIRRGRIRTLALAECLENKGRFIPAFEEIVRVLCSERTWVMPAHDAKLTNFNQISTDIDLGSSGLAWSLATADYLLADKLSPKIRRIIHNHLDERIFEPYRAMVMGKRSQNWWMTGTNNWNAVCLAGVTGAALAVIDPPEQRAFFIAAAEHYSKYFLDGFTDDGYCSEGLGYWNYGFGYYIMLSEMIHQATGGKVDLLQNNKAKQAATFGANIKIINDVYPAFADCSIRTQPSSNLMYFISRRLGLALRSWEQIDPVSPSGSLYQSMMYSFPNSASRTPLSQGSSQGPGIRSWFDEAGILISRPNSNSSSQLAVALKGGHNQEHHNHNDVGSFVVVLGDKPLLIDPGGEVYTARTFSSRRYESKVLNSFGHPVPVIAGKLQQTGSRARARLISQNFTDSTDTLVLDISSAYNVPELKKLQRKFVYSRIGKGSLCVTDEVTFSRPCTFGTALITFDNWKQSSSRSLIVLDSEKALHVEIKITGSDFKLEPETINEDVSARKKPTRLGINLTEPVTHALVCLTITPQE